MVIFAMFLWACDRMNCRLGLFRTLGTNSLVAYIFHDIAGWIFQAVFFPKNCRPGVTEYVESLGVVRKHSSWNCHRSVRILC